MDLHRDAIDVGRIRKSGAPNGPGRRSKVFAVLPAYNAAKTLAATLADVPPGCVDEFVLVDDGSSDRTIELARAMGLDVVVHPRNRGYGGNQKTC